MSDGAWGLCYDAGQVVVAAAGSHVVATCRVSREPAAFVVERAKCPKLQTSKSLSPHARRSLVSPVTFPVMVSVLTASLPPKLTQIDFDFFSIYREMLLHSTTCITVHCCSAVGLPCLYVHELCVLFTE